MSNESSLKKEFNPKDVQRIRNLISKNFNGKTAIQVGYASEKIKRIEGDIWEEKGKKWTIKNGIKQNITNLDLFKKEFLMPICCPECKVPFKNTEFDKKSFTFHKRCGDCVIKMETELKRLGLYERYEKDILNKNKNGMTYDLEQFLIELKNEKNTFMSENGESEGWNESNNNNEYNDLKEFLSKLKEITL